MTKFLIRSALLFLVYGLSGSSFAKDTNDNCWNADKTFAQIRWTTGGKEYLVVAEDTRKLPDEQKGPSKIEIFSLTATAKTLVYEDLNAGAPWLSIYSFPDADEFLVLSTMGGTGFKYDVLGFVDGKIKKVFDAGSSKQLEFYYDQSGKHEIWTYYSDYHWQHRRKFKWTGNEFKEMEDKKIKKLR